MNKLALITGASSGIGAEYARQLAAKGYNLLLTGRREELLKDICNELSTKNNISAEYQICELSDIEEIKKLEERIRNLENLEILINNAGFGTLDNFLDSDIDIETNMITVHNIATVRLTKAALSIMRKNNIGSIINVSSVAAWLVSSSSIIYCTTKLFLNNFTESLYLALKGTNIKVQALCPGFTFSDFHKKIGFKKDDPRYKMFMTSEYVVKYSLKDLDKGKVISIPGFKYKLIKLVYFIPRKLFYKIIEIGSKKQASFNTEIK